MITKLEQLTLDRFINLVCGDTSVLLERGEQANNTELAITMRNIVIEYRAIADPSGNSSYLRHIGEQIKSRISVTVFSMCQTLIELDRQKQAREVLIAYGISADSWTAKRISTEIHIRFQKAKRKMSELESETKENSQAKEYIRNAFNGLLATMMAHFKFQIDASMMWAPVFAHLVARHNAEIKAQNAAMKK